MVKSSKKIIKFYKLNNKSKLLDVGCGKGYLLYEIKILPNIRISGFDISAMQLKIVKKRLKSFYLDMMLK